MVPSSARRSPARPPGLPAHRGPATDAVPGPFGNLCYADGVLLVTTATEVWGFVSEAKKLGDRRKAVEDDPDNPAKHADLAQSLIDAGQYARGRGRSREGRRREGPAALAAGREGDPRRPRDEAKRLYEELATGDGSFAAAGAVRLAEMVGQDPIDGEAWRASPQNRERCATRTACRGRPGSDCEVPKS